MNYLLQLFQGFLSYLHWTRTMALTVLLMYKVLLPQSSKYLNTSTNPLDWQLCSLDARVKSCIRHLFVQPHSVAPFRRPNEIYCTFPWGLDLQPGCLSSNSCVAGVTVAMNILIIGRCLSATTEASSLHLGKERNYRELIFPKIHGN